MTGASRRLLHRIRVARLLCHLKLMLTCAAFTRFGPVSATLDASMQYEMSSGFLTLSARQMQKPVSVSWRSLTLQKVGFVSF